MKIDVRFFIDNSEYCEKDHVFKYNTSSCIIPRIGEHIWFTSDVSSDCYMSRYKVIDIDYCIYDDDEIGHIDIFVIPDNL